MSLALSPNPATTPTAIQFQVQVGEQALVVSEFNVTSGSYGSVGSASMQVSRRLLTSLDFDLVDVTSNSTIVPVSIWVASGQIPLTKIFDGDVMSTDWNMDLDTVTIHARDHAGVFVDQRRILARDAQAVTSALTPLSPGQQLNPSGISTINRKVSQVVEDIANQFGYTPVLNMGDSDVLKGAQFGAGDHTYMTIPQNLWQILNDLARDTGNEVYTTPDRKLVFGTPGAGLPTLYFNWNTPFVPENTPDDPQVYPCQNLRINHNPRRNATFRVLVFSYAPGTATATIGRATYVGSNANTSSIPEGLHVGNDALSADKQLLQSSDTRSGGSSRDLSSVQLYTFHWDGLTNDDANARAAAIANDIAKRFLQIHFWIDGLPTVTPTQKFFLSGPEGMPSAFTGNTWYVSGIRHVFRLPGDSVSLTDGYRTEIIGLDLPNNALAPKH